MPKSSPVSALYDGVIWLMCVSEFLASLNSLATLLVSWIFGPAVIGAA